MRAGRDWVAWCLLAAAVGCLGVALFPQWDAWVDPATGDRVSERRLGLWFSPVHQPCAGSRRRAASHGVAV